MGDVKDLQSKEALQKLRKLVTDANMCHFVTNLSKAPLSTRPMRTLQVDDQGHILFFSKEGSTKNNDIQKDELVQLFYTDKSSSEYLTVFGEAQIIKDKNLIEELWTPIAKAWFPDGKDDPSITVIKVYPVDAYYWDTKNSKMVSLIKIAIAAVTGKAMDDGGVEGTINV